MVRNEEFYLYHNEPNGCPTGLMDESGKVVWAVRYDAWWKVKRLPVDEVEQPLRLQGQYFNVETGLHYNRFRYYEPHVGSFVSQDPLRLVPGENLYSFGSNTLKYCDPLGLCKEQPKRLNYKPTSGVELVSTPGKTTTVLGTYIKDTRYIVEELGNTKSTDFGPKPNGFNLLNVPDDLYQNPKQFWNEYNQSWLDNAISRNDNILMATKPEFKTGSLFRQNSSGKLELSGFGKEYYHLRKNGYMFNSSTNQMIK